MCWYSCLCSYLKVGWALQEAEEYQGQKPRRVGHGGAYLEWQRGSLVLFLVYGAGR